MADEVKRCEHCNGEMQSASNPDDPDICPLCEARDTIKELQKSAVYEHSGIYKGKIILTCRHCGQQRSVSKEDYESGKYPTT